MLHEHRVLTTQQIVELAFPSTRAANHRLLELYRWRVIDRFQPFVTSGTAPMHYVLDVAGAIALAYEDGLVPKEIGYRHEDSIGIAHSLRLAHTVGVNGFFTALVNLSRQPDARGCLTAWWSELRCGRLFGDMVRPDAYGRWREDAQQIEFFLEFDFGTEQLNRLGRKLHDYEKLAAATGITTPVLLWLPTARREGTARRALAEALNLLGQQALVPLATSTADFPIVASANSPASARWLPLTVDRNQPTSRKRLIDLARVWDLDTPQEDAEASPPDRRQTKSDLAPPTPLPPLPSR
ncbi:replication-relaxation family protein [Umezawaea sp. NPDC059074]|uniref:replication-relaxation family protein n=1 Tax=Umezawaea sp. NPDC059074 TaxID=3346716 RepID=UPI0036D0EECC